jgi:hypothetical protein
MLLTKQQLARFRAIRNCNYQASLHLEGFISIPNQDIYLDKLTPQEIQQRIDKIKSHYAK